MNCSYIEKECNSCPLIYVISFIETCVAKGILDILNETDNSTDEELLEYAMTLVNKVGILRSLY